MFMPATTQLTENCPNCGRVNPALTLICPACGARIEVFSRAKHALDEEQRTALLHQTESYATTGKQVVDLENHQARRRILRQWIPIALISLTLLSIPVVMIAYQAGAMNRERRETIDRLTQTANQCLEIDDYACAYQSFEQLAQLTTLNQDLLPIYSSSLTGYARELFEARQYETGLRVISDGRLLLPETQELTEMEVDFLRKYADELWRSGQWEDALELLTRALSLEPDNFIIEKEIKDLYIRWIDYERVSGNLLEALKLEIEKNTRFP